MRVYFKTPGRSIVRPRGVHFEGPGEVHCEVCHVAQTKRMIVPLGVDFKTPGKFVIRPLGGPL